MDGFDLSEHILSSKTPHLVSWKKRYEEALQLCEGHPEVRRPVSSTSRRRRTMHNGELQRGASDRADLQFWGSCGKLAK